MKVWLPAIRSGTGADVFTLRLQAALAAQGVEAVVTWFPLWCELFPQRLHRARIPKGTDLVHVNGWVGASFVGRGLPVVVTVHHLVHDPAYAPFRSPAQTLYHRWHLRSRDLCAIRSAQAVTAVSRYVARTVESFGGCGPVHVIHNWVDIEKYSPAVGSRAPGPFRLLLVGNRGRRKGFDLLPRFLAELGSGFEVRCTGGLRDGADDSLPQVRWLGRLEERSLIDEYRHCDAVVSLSRYEGFGYTAVEAMACGKPFLGFHSSGLAEVVPGQAGILVEVEDVPALARAANALRQDPEACRRMGQAGRAHVVSNFGIGNARRYLELYRQLMAMEHRQVSGGVR